MAKRTVLMTFAKNDLAGVVSEAKNIYKSVQLNNLVESVKIEDADIDTLAENIIDHADNLFMFHYGGHSDQHNIVLDGFRNLDKIRLSRLLVPNENHNLSIIFLNGCLSYGHVGLLTAKGVKAIIATNVEVNDLEAVRLSKFFYKLFFEKNYTLKAAFENAEATVKGKISYPIIVNPGEIDETQSMPSSWTLFVHSRHSDILNWTLTDFVESPTMQEAFKKSEITPIELGDKSFFPSKIKILKSHIIIDIRDLEGKDAIYEKNLALIALEDGLNTYNEDFGVDGTINKINFKPGLIKKNTTIDGRVTYHMILDRWYKKDEKCNIHLYAHLVNAFLSSEEHWTIISKYLCDEIIIEIKFPIGKEFKTIEGIEIDAHTHKPYKNQPKALIIEERIVLIWTISNPKLNNSYRIVWNW